jgi:hypothetical protein
MRNVMIFLFLLVLPLGLTSACSLVVPAKVTLSPQVPIDKGTNIFVVAEAQRERIVKSLIDAGLNVSDEWTVRGYSLTVSVGRWRTFRNLGSYRTSRECDRVSNVAYVLSGGSHQLMVIKGRGATGYCEPNVFDDMSRLLAVYAAEP